MRFEPTAPPDSRETRRCPRDGHALKVHETAGVPVDVCHECGGVWFDPGEVRQVLPDFPEDDLAVPHRAHLRFYAVLRCPACRGNLVPHYYRQEGRLVEVDSCDRCEGLWIDLPVLRSLGRPRPAADPGRRPSAGMAPALGERELAEPEDPWQLRTGRLVFPRRPREWFVALTGVPIDIGNPCSIVPWATIGLIALNILAFLHLWFLSGSPDGVVEAWALTRQALVAGDWIRLVTAMFLHAGILHLAGNLFFLYTFGDNLEERFGPGSYLMLYFTCGVVAGIASCVFVLPASPDLPRLGASGAVSGILGAYLVTFPRYRILMGIPLLRFIPLVFRAPAWLFLAFWLLINVLGWFGQNATGLYAVDYVAHLAGFAVGLVGGGLLSLRRSSSLVGSEG